MVDSDAAMAYSKPEVPRSGLPSPEELAFNPLSGKLPTLACLRTAGVGLPLLAIVLAILMNADDGAVAWTAQPAAIVGILGLTAALILTWREARNRGYAMRRHDLVMRRGLFWKKQIVVPLARVQHVETHQGPLERLFSLRTLLIYTAGGGGVDLKIEGLNDEDALAIYTWLTEDRDA